MAYTRERKAFATLSRVLSSKKDIALREEYLKALNMAVKDYNTAIYENRFVVGGIAERLTVALLCAAGIEARMIGAQTAGVDISLVGGGTISVKSQFTRHRSEIRLVNTMGDSPTAWQDATFFIIAGHGIGYADPGLLPNATVGRKDVLVLPWHPLNTFWTDSPKYLIGMPIPEKPDADTSAQSEIASRTIARAILEATKSVYLLKNFPKN